MKKLVHLTTALFIFIAVSKGQAQDADRSYLPKEGEQFAAFGILNTGQFFYRKYQENSFTQYGIGGNMSFSSTPDDGSYRGGFQKSEGTKLSYHYVEISPLLTYGKAKRLQLNRRIETFFGLNYGLSFQVTSLKENHTLVDSTQFASWWNSPFNSQSHNNDFYKRKRNRQGLEGSIRPFLGVNYFITEKIALGGYYSFDGFSVNVPVGGKETVQRRVQGSTDSQNISYRVHAGVSTRLAFFGYGGIMLNYAMGRGKG